MYSFGVVLFEIFTCLTPYADAPFSTVAQVRPRVRRGTVVQCAVCSVQCAVCSVQCAVCSVQCAVCSVQCAVRGRREALAATPRLSATPPTGAV